MAIPWKTIESVPTSEGALELRQRGERDFLIMIGTQVLMNSVANRSEIMLGELGCRHLKEREQPRVLVGGLGMGCTLRAVLDTLPPSARVVVAELNPVVHTWCLGPLMSLTGGAAADSRVSVEICDVSDRIRRSASSNGKDLFDAIVLDLYRGPHAKSDPRNDPLYGSKIIQAMRAALTPDGVLAVWGEQYDEGFDKRLQDAGFKVTASRPGRGGLRHVVFLAQLGGKRRR